MAKLSKRMQKIREVVGDRRSLPALEALELLKTAASAKFTESVDLSVNLGVDARKSDQAVRGSTVLPHGTGKSIKVAVFAQGPNADAAKEAGADAVGMEDLAEEMKGGNLDFDVVIAAPDAMRVVGMLGKVLGPRGLMPNPKVGTVTPDVAGAVKNFKSGQARYRTDKAGIVHCAIGSAAFDAQSLMENLNAVVGDLRKAKPNAAKGVYLKKITVSTTMGPGITVDVSSIPSATV
nr:50S ribosomal protein L1 [Oceanococcus sp. HetDA_MAG_MS8]